MTPPKFLPAGDRALVVEFGNGIDRATNDRVCALHRALCDRPIAGVLESVPTYRSLMVCYDPCALSAGALKKKLRRLLAAPRDAASAAKAAPSAFVPEMATKRKPGSTLRESNAMPEISASATALPPGGRMPENSLSFIAYRSSEARLVPSRAIRINGKKRAGPHLHGRILASRQAAARPAG